MRLHVYVLRLCVEIFKERCLCGVPRGCSQGLLSPPVKVWGWRGQVCTEKRLWSPTLDYPCHSGRGPGWMLISRMCSMCTSTVEKAEHIPHTGSGWSVLPSFSTHTSAQATATIRKGCPFWEGASSRKSTKGISVMCYEIHREPQEGRFCVMCNIPTTVVD